ncbi:ATP synthase subunit I [Flavobacterium crassostreae]|nr:ATP synthase subunit I [Flavobacterium crassostreae]
MSDILHQILAFIEGTLLGIIFFGGLWFTVKKAVGAKTPAIWFFSSLFLRLAVVLIGFYLIVQGGLERIIMSLIGFIVARILVTYYTKSRDKKRKIKEVYHEAKP